MAKGIFLSILRGAEASKQAFRNAKYMTADVKAAAESIFTHIQAPAVKTKTIGKNIFEELEAGAAKQLKRISNFERKSETGIHGEINSMLKKEKQAAKNIRQSSKGRPNRNNLFGKTEELEAKGCKMQNDAIQSKGNGAKLNTLRDEPAVTKPNTPNNMGKSPRGNNKSSELTSSKPENTEVNSTKSKNTGNSSKKSTEKSSKTEIPRKRSEKPKGEKTRQDSPKSRNEGPINKHTKTETQKYRSESPKSNTSNSKSNSTKGNSTASKVQHKKRNNIPNKNKKANNRPLLSQRTINKNVTKVCKSVLGTAVSKQSRLAKELVERCLKSIAGRTIYVRSCRTTAKEAVKCSITISAQKFTLLRKKISKKAVQEFCHKAIISTKRKNRTSAKIKEKILKSKLIRVKNPFTCNLRNFEQNVTETKLLRFLGIGETSEQRIVLMLNSDAITLEEAMHLMGERGAFNCIFKNPALLRKYEREAINYISSQNKVDDLVKLANSSRAIELILNFNRIDSKQELYKCLEKRASSLQKYMFKDRIKPAA